MYRTVEQAVTAYQTKYEINRAIQRAHQERSKARSEDTWNFWDEVATELKKFKPQKKFKSKEE
ncbi:hypothetical protein [Aeromonas jandaei]|uniref:hypothetical protein n=1 Tax=Aeromonas jandaei TaxID=650 RepID=UPI00111726F7|nr:hypothetical protein [Aeromonas jandaei]TNH92891.1 hypothetical protein CF104_21820 [Aeromonas jandaei]